MKKSFNFVFVFFIFFVSCDKSRDVFKNMYSDNAGIILADNVRIRNYPSVRSKILGLIHKGKRVEILKTINKIEQIGNFKDSWLKIKTPDKKTGYIFGAFVFNLNFLYKGVWGYKTYSEWTFGIKFTDEGEFKFKYISYSHADRRETISKYKNRFLVIKNMIILKGKKLLKGTTYYDSLPSTFYLFRYKGQCYLSKKDVSINENENLQKYLLTKILFSKNIFKAEFSDFKYPSINQQGTIK